MLELEERDKNSAVIRLGKTLVPTYVENMIVSLVVILCVVKLNFGLIRIIPGQGWKTGFEKNPFFALH